MSGDPGRTLPTLDTPWSIGEKNYSKVRRILRDREVKSILELGSGASTLRLLTDYPLATLVSVEQDREFHRKTRDLLAHHGLAHGTVYHCPLRFQRMDLRIYTTYSLPSELSQYHFDFVLIDGPIEHATIRGREAVLYQIFPHIRVGGLIALDDYHRPSARRVVQNWLNSYPEHLVLVESHPRIVFLQKTGAQKRPRRPSLLSVCDNWYAAFHFMYRRSGTFVRQILWE